MKLFLALMALALSTAPASADERPSGTDASRAISASTGAVLRGDSRGAVRALGAVPAAHFSGRDAAYRACMLERFDRASPPPLVGTVEDPVVRSVLAAYQQYWWRALAEPSRRSNLEHKLLQDLRAVLGTSGEKLHDFDSLEPVLQAALKRRNYHSLLGLTPPLRELMLWRKQTSRDYDVELPEGRQRVRVELLDDFVSLGWSAYGRCERGSNGGWATEEALFAVVPGYKDGLESEAFTVVFLGHEAQHFADKTHLPRMENWELEYRAKLVELAQASEALSRKRLGSFIASQGDAPEAPHPYANKRVVAALRARLGAEPDAVPVARLQAVARAELLADTRRRRSGQ